MVEAGTTGYLFGGGSEGPSAGNEEGPLAYDIEYELKMQSEIVREGNVNAVATQPMPLGPLQWQSIFRTVF